MLPRLAKADESNSDEIIDEINEAADNPLIDQNSQYVRFEVRLNQSEFTYIASGANDTPKVRHLSPARDADWWFYTRQSNLHLPPQRRRA